ncbi:TlpA family protein disulfide reductase [Chryseobacterium sp. A321]
MNNQDIPTDPKKDRNKLWSFVKKNGFTVLMLGLMAAMVLSPDFKALTIRGLMLTGLFNPKLETKAQESQEVPSVEFAFANEIGEVQTISSLKGKVVFINFWASWCGPCRAEFPSIQALYEEFKDNPNVVFLLLNEDSDPSLGTDYLAKEHFSMPFYQTVGPVPSEVYKGVLPTTLVLDKEGKSALHHTGFANYSAPKFKAQLAKLMAE